MESVIPIVAFLHMLVTKPPPGSNRNGCAFFCKCPLTILVLFLLFGCASGNYGRVELSAEVARDFEKYHVFKDHRYYYLNQENKPYAVVAVQHSYRIESAMWREFDPHGGKLEKIVDLVKEFSGESSVTYGSYLRDAQGNAVGYWYSKLRMVGVKVDNEARLVSINTTTPWLRDDDRVYGPGIGVGIGRGNSGVGVRF
jgi:hypothetical protein